MENTLITQLSTLGHEGRLAVFRLLMRRYPDAVPAGEIAAALDLRPSTLSDYLASLRAAGLIGQRREATSLFYKVNLDGADGMVRALYQDCCRGRPDLCATGSDKTGAWADEGTDMAGAVFDVLFLCTGNSARSIMAEVLLRDMGGVWFNVHSAGTQPYSELNPYALRLLALKGHDTSGLRTKHAEEFRRAGAPQMDFVFTVCDRAANEDCPAWPGQPISAHWGQPDPVKATGTEAERALAFQEVYGALRSRIAAFTALPLHRLDRRAIQYELDALAMEKEMT